MKTRKPRNYWTLSNCRVEALKYSRISDFKRKSGGAYNSAKSNNWLTNITKHIKPTIKPVGYWQKMENCRIEALKYETKHDFRTKSAGAYDASLNHKWIDEICQHMIKIGHRYLKCVYVYEFSDNYVYVGITYNIERRKHDREKCKTDSVTKHIEKTGLHPTFKQVTDFIDVNKAVRSENLYVEKYLKDGWMILNQSKTGSIGSVRKWTKEKCVEEGLKYINRTDFSKRNGGAYQAAVKYGWLDEVCEHMLIKIKPYGYWNYEKCKKVFKFYNRKKEVKKHEPTAYSVAYKNNWLKDFEKYMINGRKPNGYWTIDKCIEEAIKYRKRIEFQKNSGSAYMIAYRNNWLNKIYLSVGL